MHIGGEGGRLRPPRLEGTAMVFKRLVRMLRRPLPLIALCAALLVAQGALPQIAFAHATPVRSDPAADVSLPASPARVTIWFSEAVAPTLSGIQVLDTSAQRVDKNDSATDRSDPKQMSVSLNANLQQGT